MPNSTTAKRRPVIAGNWKMNGLAKSKREIKALIGRLAKTKRAAADVVICPPATLLHGFKPLVTGTRLALGAQDCHARQSGAHTGDLSAGMLKEAGAKWIIVGHSERRTDHGETDADVCAKAEAVLAEKLKAIVCVGESEQERLKGTTLRVIGRQLKGSLPADARSTSVVVAYEPVWAIGTGRTPTLGDIDEVHRFIRRKLVEKLGDDGQRVRILYGGSVKPQNARDIMFVNDVDGALVGGASLKVKDFWPIVQAGL